MSEIATDAVSLKRFFRASYQIPVRVNTGKGKADWIHARIAPVKTGHRHELRYDHSFPEALCNQCMRIVYEGHPQLREQITGGNIGRHSIAMLRSQWERLLQQHQEQVNVAEVAVVAGPGGAE